MDGSFIGGLVFSTLDDNEIDDNSCSNDNNHTPHTLSDQQFIKNACTIGHKTPKKYVFCNIFIDYILVSELWIPFAICNQNITLYQKIVSLLASSSFDQNLAYHGYKFHYHHDHGALWHPVAPQCMLVCLN